MLARKAFFLQKLKIDNQHEYNVGHGHYLTLPVSILTEFFYTLPLKILRIDSSHKYLSFQYH